jgi:hypothetical protein
MGTSGVQLMSGQLATHAREVDKGVITTDVHVHRLRGFQDLGAARDATLIEALGAAPDVGRRDLCRNTGGRAEISPDGVRPVSQEGVDVGVINSRPTIL